MKKMFLFPIIALLCHFSYAQDIALSTRGVRHEIAPEDNSPTPRTDLVFREIADFLDAHLRYPEESYVYGTEGAVKLIADLTPQGTIKSARVDQSLDRFCDAEALRVLHLMQEQMTDLFGPLKEASSIRIVVNFKI